MLKCMEPEIYLQMVWGQCIYREWASRYGKMLEISESWRRVHKCSLYYLAFHNNVRKEEKWQWERQTFLREGQAGELVCWGHESPNPRGLGPKVALMLTWAETRDTGFGTGGHVDEGGTVVSWLQFAAWGPRRTPGPGIELQDSQGGRGASKEGHFCCLGNGCLLMWLT